MASLFSDLINLKVLQPRQSKVLLKRSRFRGADSYKLLGLSHIHSLDYLYPFTGQIEWKICNITFPNCNLDPKEKPSDLSEAVPTTCDSEVNAKNQTEKLCLDRLSVHYRIDTLTNLSDLHLHSPVVCSQMN